MIFTKAFAALILAGASAARPRAAPGNGEKALVARGGYYGGGGGGGSGSYSPPSSPDCGAWATYQNGPCVCKVSGATYVPSSNACACLPGQIVSNNACACPNGQSVQNGRCAPTTPGCGQSATYHNGACVCSTASQTYDAGSKSCLLFFWPVSSEWQVCS